MPDCHAITKDLDQAKSEMMKRFDLAKDVLSGCGLELEDFQFALRIVKEFYDENKEFVMERYGHSYDLLKKRRMTGYPNENMEDTFRGIQFFLSRNIQDNNRTKRHR